MLLHVPIFLVLLFCGTIIALLNFTSFLKILCNFGTSGKEIRQKEMDKSSYKIPCLKSLSRFGVAQEVG